MTKDEEKEHQSTALETARSVLASRRRVEEQLIAARNELEEKSAQLEYQLAMTRATLESTTDGILVTDGKGRITDFNTRFVELWPIAPGIMEARDHRRVLEHTQTLVTEPRAYREGVESIYGVSPAETRDVIELLDGRVIERVTRPHVVGGQGVGRVWSFRDVTEHRRAEREHAYLAAIVTSSNDAIISKTLDGIITSWNGAAEHMFGYTAAEAIGRPITMIIPPDRIDEERDFLRRLRRGERIDNFTSLRVTKDGRHINVSLTISPVRDENGQVIGASKTARDITEREQLLAGEQAARARAEEASRLKDEFLATVSHELRTPLNAILGWAQMMRSGPLDPDQTQRALEVIERNAHTQAQVIEDILDVSRIITGKLRLNVQSLMPTGVIQSALESIKPTAEAKGVRVHTMLDPSAGPITGDPNRLQQIVWNLLSNSIKFTPKGGRVEIRLERIKSHIEIVVSDTGEGIEPEFLPHVFDRFRQADASSSRSSTGLGLGLAIVRHLVELHGGLVTANSPGKGQGSTFSIRLPLRPLLNEDTDEERVHPTTARHGRLRTLDEAPRLHGVRVLVVDDEQDTRRLLREVLEACGAEVRDAGSSGKGVEMFIESHPDVIVSDIGMPGEDGYTFIRRIRELEKTTGARTPAVALTAYARSEDRMRALLAGYQVHVSKPIEPMEFVLVVAGVVQAPPPETRGSRAH
jgi:PAS domain S-box-containing protein